MKRKNTDEDEEIDVLDDKEDDDFELLSKFRTKEALRVAKILKKKLDEEIENYQNSEDYKQLRETLKRRERERIVHEVQEEMKIEKENLLREAREKILIEVNSDMKTDQCSWTKSTQDIQNNEQILLKNKLLMEKQQREEFELRQIEKRNEEKLKEIQQKNLEEKRSKQENNAQSRGKISFSFGKK